MGGRGDGSIRADDVGATAPSAPGSATASGPPRAAPPSGFEVPGGISGPEARVSFAPDTVSGSRNGAAVEGSFAPAVPGWGSSSSQHWSDVDVAAGEWGAGGRQGDQQEGRGAAATSVLDAPPMDHLPFQLRMVEVRAWR